MLLTVMYASLMIYYLIGFNQLPEVDSNAEIFSTKVSIIIPARNEEKNINYLFADIIAQNFPKHLIEIILVDDHSEDATLQVAQSFLQHQKLVEFQVLKLADAGKIEQAYKKKAIDFAMKSATGKLIITTDADCRLNENWLRNIVAHYETTNHKMIAAPVKYYYDDSFFQQFQALDFIGLMGITGASIQKGFYNMCNGANLCYEKEAFITVNGFKGNDNISSGDDMFLMHKIAERFPNQISFIKNNDVCVATHPKENISEFLHQRLRWTSKSTSYSDKRITAILVMAYLFNVSIVFNFLVGIVFHYFIYIFLIQFISKCIVEFLFLRSTSKYFNQIELMKIFVPAQFVHIIYIVSVGLLGQLKSFSWKGRSMKK
jgi:cellulose synthase/poly-beta-1,6-N-acetylglucosamine synthase-like glycosyltransferase